MAGNDEKATDTGDNGNDNANTGMAHALRGGGALGGACYAGGAHLGGGGKKARGERPQCAQSAEEKEHLVFILWGAYAQRKGAFIDRNRHLVLTSAHPSPLSAYNGFFGNKHFSRTNEYLETHGETAIQW